jgi:nitrate reductase (cytochrome), electron transfer subunit
MRTIIQGLLGLLVASLVHAQSDNMDTLRGSVALDAEGEPPRMEQVENQDLRRPRNYPMQPPTIPHKIDDYQVDLNANRCMACHSRRQTGESQAPMVSVTHYMDRDGNFLAEVSPRRYFCQQCHVPQTNARPLVENTFEDVDQIIERQRQTQQ